MLTSSAEAYRAGHGSTRVGRRKTCRTSARAGCDFWQTARVSKFRAATALWVAITGIALASGARPASAAAPAFIPHECAAAAAAAGAKCGVVQVPENHANPRGPQIGLNIIVLPASRSGGRSGIAQYDLEGGPGFAVTDFLSFYAGEGAIYRQRDIVLADMRGTGGSGALRCAAVEALQEKDSWAPLYPPALVAECAQELSRTRDLRQYGTAAAARDIDLVRRALGYEQLDLNAVSYGTTLALRYMAEYPRAVHAAALTGTVPAGRTPPRFHAQAAMPAMALLSEECGNDARCRLLGDPNLNFRAARDLIARESPLRAEVFAEKVRVRLYAPMRTRSLPALLARAASGDLAAFTSAGGAGERIFADGVYLSITCAESLARFDVDAAIAGADQTDFRSYRLRRQRDACAHWPVAPADARLLRQPANRIPTLFLGGARDPVSPPEWAKDVAAAFRKSREVVIPDGAHVPEGLSGLDTCLDAVILRLFETGDVAHLDTGCFVSMKPGPFADP